MKQEVNPTTENKRIINTIKLSKLKGSVLQKECCALKCIIIVIIIIIVVVLLVAMLREFY
jgi:t-SNARE complex subunit (syntaxin)